MEEGSKKNRRTKVLLPVISVKLILITQLSFFCSSLRWLSFYELNFLPCVVDSNHSVTGLLPHDLSGLSEPWKVLFRYCHIFKKRFHYSWFTRFCQFLLHNVCKSQQKCLPWSRTRDCGDQPLPTASEGSAAPFVKPPIGAHSHYCHISITYYPEHRGPWQMTTSEVSLAVRSAEPLQQSSTTHRS